MPNVKAIEKELKALFDDKDIGSCAVLGPMSAQIAGAHPIPLDIWLARCHSTIYHLGRHGAIAGPNVRDMLATRKTLPVPFGDYRANYLVFEHHTIMLYILPKEHVFYASVRHGADRGIPPAALKRVRATVANLKKILA